MEKDLEEKVKYFQGYLSELEQKQYSLLTFISGEPP
jgi:hypothetical protein